MHQFHSCLFSPPRIQLCALCNFTLFDLLNLTVEDTLKEERRVGFSMKAGLNCWSFDYEASLVGCIITTHCGDVQGDILRQTLQFPGDSPAGFSVQPERGSFHYLMAVGAFFSHIMTALLMIQEKKQIIVLLSVVFCFYRSAETVNHPGTQSPCGQRWGKTLYFFSQNKSNKISILNSLEWLPERS